MLQLTKAKGSIRDHVYETLKSSIMSLKLPPGHFISEKEAIEMLQVSRTPIREAFVKLVQEGLIETIPQKGSYVSHIDLDHVEESRFVREQLETSIVRLACRELTTERVLHLQNLIALQELCVKENNHERLFELDEEFHREMFYGCGKRRTWAMLQQMATHLKRLRMLRLFSIHDWEIILDQHKRIVKAVKEGDEDTAEQTMREHLKRMEFEKFELLNKYPAYFKSSNHAENGR